MSDADSGYVEGDINQVDDEFEDDFDDEVDDDETDGDEGDGDEAGGGATGADAHNRSRSDAPLAVGVLTHIATSLADEPDAVSVATEARGGRVTLRLSVAQPDMGRVIGRRGRTAQAIRALVAAAGAKEGVTTSVDIVD